MTHRSKGAWTRGMIGLAVALVLPMGQASAEQKVRILTPTSDACPAFTQALNTGDKVTLALLGGWALGYISGVAEGSGANFLRNATADEIYRQLALDCQKQPRQPFSAAVSMLARSLMAGYQRQ